MRWSATICWYRDEAYDMVHANEVECNYLLVAEMKHMAWCSWSAPHYTMMVECKRYAWCMLMRWSATICWCRDEAYVECNMVHANEVECNYLLVQR